MAIEKYEVETYEIDFKCDICGKGYYRPTGEIFPTNPCKYTHKCVHCGAEMIVMGHTYPHIITERGRRVSE